MARRVAAITLGLDVALEATPLECVGLAGYTLEMLFWVVLPIVLIAGFTFGTAVWMVAVDKRATLGTPTAATYARYAVARIGYDTMVSPYWVHEVLVWLMVSARQPRMDERAEHRCTSTDARARVYGHAYWH